MPTRTKKLQSTWHRIPDRSLFAITGESDNPAIEFVLGSTVERRRYEPVHRADANSIYIGLGFEPHPWRLTLKLNVDKARVTSVSLRVRYEMWQAAKGAHAVEIASIQGSACDCRRRARNSLVSTPRSTLG